MKALSLPFSFLDHQRHIGDTKQSNPRSLGISWVKKFNSVESSMKYLIVELPPAF